MDLADDDCFWEGNGKEKEEKTRKFGAEFFPWVYC